MKSGEEQVPKNNQIRVNQVIIKNNRIDYYYEVTGGITKYFDLDHPFFIEYEKEIIKSPEGLAVIPLLANILPIAWLSDSEIYLDEIDRSFFNSLDNIKKGYEGMYPGLLFKGNLLVENIIDYQYESNTKQASYFSGGVDSTSTLLRRLPEKPDLLTIWGSDLLHEHVSGWQKVQQLVENTSKKYGLKHVFIKSNFRSFINYKTLNNDFKDKLNDNWWHGIQHGLGIIGHAAPISIQNGYGKIYMPSTRSKKDPVKLPCASDPTIDNMVRFGETLVEHEGYDYSRQDKIKQIIDYKKRNQEKIYLRVCWKSNKGDNCCKCEKCARTIMGLISDGAEPNDFGFNVSETDLYRIRDRIKKDWVFSEIERTLWEDIKYNMIANKDSINFKSPVNWVMTDDFFKSNNSLLKIMRNNVNRTELKRYLYKNIRNLLNGTDPGKH